TNLYYYMLEYKKLTGSVVRNISTTHLLDKIANAYGDRCIETPVGFKYIAEEMLLNDAIIGGESSGGITIRDHLLEKDGILAGGLILEMLAKTGKRLTDIRTEIAQKFGRFSFVEDNLMFPRNRRDMLIEFLNHRYIPDEIKGTAIQAINRKDGIKYIFDNGDWLSVRFSGTEPLLRLTAESTKMENAMILVNNMKDVIEIQLAEEKRKLN